MKKLLYGLFLILPLVVSATNWDLFPLNQKMWFRGNIPTGRSDLYLIDSVATINLTTFFYPRTSYKIMGAGWCSPLSYEAAGQQNNWYYSNPGAFIALSTRNDTVFFHQPNGVNFYFLPLAEPGQSWTVDYTSNYFTCTQITITCESITQGDVLGIPDLIKTFTLQANGSLPDDVNLDTMNFKLSQHYGFIENIPYQTLINSNVAPLSESLIGLETESIITGYTMPSFTDFGYVYETFGTSKHIPVMLQVLLIRTEMPDNPLTAKCFIYDVMHWLFSLEQI